MPIFTINDRKLRSVDQTNFALEKDLQALIESNLSEVFNCRFVASEFVTGAVHAGRIDTLALSEDGNPVIIEYKKVESSDLINQSLFYLSWIEDHRGDFEIAVQKTLGGGVEVDWSDVRVICLAPNFKKYDLHAVQMMGANIELWQYRLYTNQTLYLDEVFRKSMASTTPAVTKTNGKNPVMVEAGKKAAITRATSTWTLDHHFDGKPKAILELVYELQEYILGLDPSIEEAPKKFYIAYKTTQNIVCMEIQKTKINLFLKLDPAKVTPLPKFARDVTQIGHFGTGDLELAIGGPEDVETAKPIILRAYEHIGG